MALETLSKLTFEYPHQHQEKIITALNIDGELYELHDSKLKQDLDNIIAYVDSTVDASNRNFSYIDGELSTLYQLVNNLSGVDADTLSKLNAIIEELESGNGTQGGSAWVTLVDRLQGIDTTVVDYITNYLNDYYTKRQIDDTLNNYATQTYVVNEVSNLERTIKDELQENYATKNHVDTQIDNVQQNVTYLQTKVDNDYYNKNDIEEAFRGATVSYKYENVSYDSNDYTIYDVSWDQATTTLNINSNIIRVVTNVNITPVNETTSLQNVRLGGGSNSITPGSGDIDRNGTINILDLAKLINLINEGKYDQEGDMNGDGKLDQTDHDILQDKVLFQ